MQFTSVEQRMAFSYLDTFVDFVPQEQAAVTDAEQRAFYEQMRALYQLAFDRPEFFAAQLHEDDAFPNRFNKKSYGKPDLISHMRKFTKEMNSLLGAMFEMGRGGEPKLSRRQKSVLAALGIADGAALPPAWQWMACREGANVTAFSRCLFAPGHAYYDPVYARLLGDAPAFETLTAWMRERGYIRFDQVPVLASDDPCSVTYANLAWSPDAPGGGFEYKIRHTGVSMRYDAYAMEPAVLGLCIPGGLGACLSAFDKMPEQVQGFVWERTKRCDACGYCVQTDKTRERGYAYRKITHQGESRALCTYFPGYQYCWTRLDAPLADQLIGMMDFMDGLRTPQNK